MTGEGPRVGAVIGVIIGTPPDRFEAMRRFYVETLGLPVRVDRPGHLNFQWGTTRLTIGAHGELNGATSDPLRVLINLEVDGIEAVVARLRAAGVTFLREPSQEAWGGWIATFEDPDRNTLQLMQLPPGGE